MRNLIGRAKSINAKGKNRKGNPNNPYWHNQTPTWALTRADPSPKWFDRLTINPEQTNPVSASRELILDPNPLGDALRQGTWEFRAESLRDRLKSSRPDVAGLTWTSPLGDALRQMKRNYRFTCILSWREQPMRPAYNTG